LATSAPPPLPKIEPMNAFVAMTSSTVQVRFAPRFARPAVTPCA
jgi:hypothetical protein